MNACPTYKYQIYIQLNIILINILTCIFVNGTPHFHRLSCHLRSASFCSRTHNAQPKSSRLSNQMRLRELVKCIYLTLIGFFNCFISSTVENNVRNTTHVWPQKTQELVAPSGSNQGRRQSGTSTRFCHFFRRRRYHWKTMMSAQSE